MPSFAGSVARFRRRDSELPAHPAAAAAPDVCFAAGAAALGLGVGLAWKWTAAVACGLLFIAACRAIRAALERSRLRTIADEWILWGAAARPSSRLLGWRAGELMSPRLRSTLAHSLARIESETRGKLLPGAVPLNKRALRQELPLLCVLHALLADAARPVSVRGMLLVDRLVTEAGSPLYASVSDDVLADTLCDALTALEDAPIASAA
jgi:hypothetical protein